MIPQPHIWNFLQSLPKDVIRKLLPYAESYMENGSPLGGKFSTYKEFYELLLRPLGDANEGKQYSLWWPADPVDPREKVCLTTLRVVDETRVEFWEGVMLYIINRSKPPERSKGTYMGPASWYPE